MIEVPRREIYRYLGFRRSVPEEAVVKAVDSCLAELQESVTPRSVYRQFLLDFPEEEDEAEDKGEEDGDEADRKTGSCDEKKSAPLLRIAGMEIRSRNLAVNLRGCERVYLMAATLGLGPDRLIARARVGHISRAVILQAAAAAMIEAWTDTVNREIIDRAKAQGLYCRPRFSPGYGDFSLEYQKQFAEILRMQKEIGVSLTESLLMMPSKSVTAVIGLSREQTGCAIRGCEACARSGSCAFSRTRE
ncbi:MAG: vitamin B12 dependent-methionine synthase activation domain-containing protein [Eubacteriales bacterium]|nr:vitamin B12 dependent-methionine synthase activation domain-containing protein [Eubacteriales bacterium]